MASLFHTPGPVHAYVRFRGASQFSYLGTCEVSPEVDGDPAYLPVLNDLYSRTKSLDDIYDGQTDTVTGVWNRLDLAVWRRCRDPQSHSAVLADHGTDSRLEVGHRVRGIGDFELALVHGFYGTANATADLTQGRLYFSALVGNYRETGATRVLSAAVRFDCKAARDAATGDFRLYTESLAGYTFPSPS